MPCARPPALIRGFLCVALLAGLRPALSALGAEPLLSIGVQSTVTNPLVGLAGSGGSGRLYVLLDVQQVKSQARLVKPVDETQLARRLIAALDTRGFHPVEDQQKPEMLLMVQYGRGWLKNPYRPNGGILAIEVSGLMPASVVAGTSDSAAGGNTGVSSQMMNGMSPGFEAESQKASYEKLFVRVTAWAYTTDPKARAQRLWQTTMVVDDPDHRDLNAVLPQMVTAGTPYFERATEQYEVSVSVPASDTQVKVGTPVVVGEPPLRAGPAPAAVTPVPAAAPALKRFELPAGEALTTLQAFSRQSGEEIIYPADQVQSVRTHAISGTFSTRSALERMLDQTGLVAVWDEKSGICIIRRDAR